MTKNSSEYELFRERYWEVISTDNLGRVFVLEYSMIQRLEDDSPRMYIAQRLNIFIQENLEQWSEDWNNSDLK